MENQKSNKDKGNWTIQKIINIVYFFKIKNFHVEIGRNL